MKPVFKLNISDILYTYILGKVKKAKELMLKYHDFRICVEIPIKIKNQKLSYKSLPSFERTELLEKKVNALKDGLLILIALIKFLSIKK